MENSAFGRVVSVLVSPVKTFASIRERPTWLLALGVLVVTTVLSSGLAAQKADWAQATRDSLASSSRGQQMTEEQRERAIDIAEKVTPTIVTVFPLVLIPIVLLISSGFLLVVVKLLGGEMGFAQAFSTSVHAGMPQAVGRLLTLPVILARDSIPYLDVQSNTVLKSNLGAFAGEDTGPALLALLASVDLFALWGVVLTAIGIAVVGRLSKGTAAMASVGIWIFWVLVGVGLASLGGR